MPGWLIHLDAARKAIDKLTSNPGALPIFGAGGPKAADVQAIAKNHPAYVALGAIGPDIFFLLPDFKPPVGTMLWGAANTIRELYTWWDDNFLGPWEDQIGPIESNLSDTVDAVTGGLASQLSAILSRAFAFLIEYVEVLVIRQYDVFSFLGSGVPTGYDEQTFFWSDMLHYRKTYDFARHLWVAGTAMHDPRMQAFALGWMSHLAADVAGHCFVNEKSGGPYRLHWQRHHLVENHMDAKVYDSERGTQPIYNMLSNAALHLWIAFNPDGSSRVNFFDAQPGPSYNPGDGSAAQLDRKSKWDYDSPLPGDLAKFLAQALRDVFNDAVTNVAGPKGQWASHPTIIEELQPGSGGYADADAITATYWWLYRYVKWTTTDYYKIRRPSPPDVVNIPDFPSPPGTGESDPGPGPSDDSAWHDFLEILLAIFAWIIYLAQVAAWPATAIVSLITSAGTYPVRQLLYENLELPLYNAWLALHWYLSMTGFNYPMQEEINPGLMTLGVGVGDVWGSVQAALSDPSGGLHMPAAGTEPSGRDRDRTTPHEVVVDPQGWVASAIHQALNNVCGASEAPSEFLRPWKWPDKDNQGDMVPSEQPLSPASPYVASNDATVLIGGAAGNAAVRTALEHCHNEAETIKQATAHLPHGEHLGDPVDYTGYVIAWLTRDTPGEIANFNLDSDRGYGYLCWDWLRAKSPDMTGTPASFKGHADPHRYRAPIRPGAGWCDQELDHPSPHGANDPVMHDPVNPDKTGPVRIRYIDREDKTP